MLDLPVIRYRVVVRDEGVVYDGVSLSEANRSYADFVARFKVGADRSLSDSVTLFKNYEIVRQWYRPSQEAWFTPGAVPCLR